VDDQRRALLDRVIQAEARWRVEAEQLRRFPRDVEVPLVTLRLSDLRRILHRYADGLVTDADLVAWADFLEVRPDVAVENDLDVIKECLFELSEPLMNSEPYPEVVRAWLRRLDSL
jgi:hypothetical protein